MQLFSADATMFLKKCFFVPENMNKPSSKVAHNLANFFFVITANMAQNRQFVRGTLTLFLLCDQACQNIPMKFSKHVILRL